MAEIKIYNKFPNQKVGYSTDGGETYPTIDYKNYATITNTTGLNIMIVANPIGGQEKVSLICVNNDGSDNGVTLTIEALILHYWLVSDITNNKNLCITIREP